MSNRNLTNLAMLYDFASQELDKVLHAGVPLEDIGIRKKLSFVHEVAKAMSLVYQIENLRQSQSEDKVGLPEERVVEDIAKVKPRDDTFNPSSGLSGHQGWKPF